MSTKNMRAQRGRQLVPQDRELTGAPNWPGSPPLEDDSGTGASFEDVIRPNFTLEGTLARLAQRGSRLAANGFVEESFGVLREIEAILSNGRR